MIFWLLIDFTHARLPFLGGVSAVTQLCNITMHTVIYDLPAPGTGFYIVQQIVNDDTGIGFNASSNSSDEEYLFYAYNETLCFDVKPTIANNSVTTIECRQCTSPEDLQLYWDNERETIEFWFQAFRITGWIIIGVAVLFFIVKTVRLVRQHRLTQTKNSKDGELAPITRSINNAELGEISE